LCGSSTGLLLAQEHSDGGSVPKKMQGICSSVEGLTAYQVSVVHGIILSVAYIDQNVICDEAHNYATFALTLAYWWR
jgi:hypothetical protein